MPAHDLLGNPYARLEDLKAGDMVTVDGDNDCMRPWTDYRVHAEGTRLYLKCDEGEHDLDGQLEDDGYLTGIYHAGTVKCRPKIETPNRNP